MIDRLLALIEDESKWLTASMGLALLGVATLLFRLRRSELPVRRRVAAAMNLFFGVTIGAMAFGHLLAVTTKLASGTLSGSAPGIYAIGVALAVPSAAILLHTRSLVASDADRGRTTIALNAWLAVTLLVLGIHNLPLAAPGIFNVLYQLHTRRAVGWAIVGAAVAVNAGLFVASLVFLASGQSFEEFSGMR